MNIAQRKWNAALLLCTAAAAPDLSFGALIDRGGGLIYDTDFNITWQADAGLALSNTFGVSGINPISGQMDWFSAQNWISAMNDANYLGFNDWRLPATLYPDATCDSASGGYNCTGSEMGHLYYNEIGGMANQDIDTTHNANYDLFHNIQPNYYWSGTEYTQSPSTPNDNAWLFYFYGGVQTNSNKGDVNTVWAVRDGDVVPLPASAWLFGTGLIGLVGMAKRTKKQDS